jgi:hypothetical protein
MVLPSGVEAVDEVEDLGAGAGVEIPGGLVGEDHEGVIDE